VEQHAFNLFPVTNQDQLSISYRLVEVVGELGAGSDDPDLPAKNLNLLTKKIAFGQKLPVAIIRGGENPLLAISASHPITAHQYQLTPHVATLRPRDEVHSVAFRDLDSSTREIALSFLGWQLRGHLYEHTELWRRSPNAFYRKEPVNVTQRNRALDIYGGFSPRFLFVDGRLHVAVPVNYCYTDSRWADQAFDKNQFKRLGGRTMLYHYGGRLFPVKFQKRTGKTLKEQEFLPEDGTTTANVFDWTVKNAGRSPGGRELQPNSPAIRYKYPGTDQEWYGALCLCKLMLNNEDPRVASSRRDHQRTPDQRIRASVGIVKQYLSHLTLSGVEVKIDSTPRTRQGKRFKCPAIQFGVGKIVRVSDNPKNGEITLGDLPQVRRRLLEDKNVGLAVLSDLDDQILIAPRSLDVPVINDLKSRIETLVTSLLRKNYSLQMVRYQDEHQHTLRAQVEAIVGALNENEVVGARGILVLPPRAQPDLHNYIKKKLRDRVQFQCMAAEKIAKFYGTDGNSHHQLVQPEPSNRFQSYLLNAIMGLLIVNRQWPWVLHEPTHYDVYIALDVLDHTAALTFFYNGGRLCAMRDQESSDKEKLSKRVVAKLVYDGLKQDLQDLDEPPHSIVLRRDGRVYESEWLGFQDTISSLKGEGVLPSDIQIGAVEIPKHYACGVRLVECSATGLRNPTIGCWEKLSDNEGLVCTTGWPFNIPGTVEPLVARIVRGNLDIVSVLEDTFGMSQLCWPVPTGCMRLSIDLKLCDEHLRAFAAQADEDSALFGESEETDEEPLLAAAN
jgi:hypothetical protein